MLDTINIFKVNFRRNAINEGFMFTCALMLIRCTCTCSAGILWCTSVQQFMLPVSKRLRGILVLDCPWVSLSVSLYECVCVCVCVCVTLALV